MRPPCPSWEGKGLGGREAQPGTGSLVLAREAGPGSLMLWGRLCHFAWTRLVKRAPSAGAGIVAARGSQAGADDGLVEWATVGLLTPGFHPPFRKPQREGILRWTRWRSLGLGRWWC